ncbi:TPA: hypothetical protein N2X82_002375 [Escherichia coli]|nr:hypothetical protein [Escherichia coli]
MAIYDLGTASLAANGEVTGVGTTWKAPLTLIRVGATIVFKTEPVQIYTISEIISDTRINVYNPNSETVPAGTGYAILAHDGITVQGLAQDVAETLRYYQSKETSIESLIEIIENSDIDVIDGKIQEMQQILSSTMAAEGSAKSSSDSALEYSNKSISSANESKSARDEAVAAKNSTIEAINNAGDAGTLVTLSGSNGASLIGTTDGSTIQDEISSLKANGASIIRTTDGSTIQDEISSLKANGASIIRTTDGSTIQDEISSLKANAGNLRAELASDNGFNIVNYKRPGVNGSVINSLSTRYAYTLDAVADFGADPTGSTDSYEALQAWANACVAGPWATGTINGIFRISKTLEFANIAGLTIIANCYIYPTFESGDAVIRYRNGQGLRVYGRFEASGQNKIGIRAAHKIYTDNDNGFSFSYLYGACASDALTGFEFGDAAYPSGLVSEMSLIGGYSVGCPCAVRAIGSQCYINLDGFDAVSGGVGDLSSVTQYTIHVKGANVKVRGGEIQHNNNIYGASILVEPQTDPLFNNQFGSIEVNACHVETAAQLCFIANLDGVESPKSDFTNISFKGLRGYHSQDNGPFISTHSTAIESNYSGTISWANMSGMHCGVTRTQPNIQAGSLSRVYYDETYGAGFRKGLQSVSGGILHFSRRPVCIAQNTGGQTLTAATDKIIWGGLVSTDDSYRWNAQYSGGTFTVPAGGLKDVHVHAVARIDTNVQLSMTVFVDGGAQSLAIPSAGAAELNAFLGDLDAGREIEIRASVSPGSAILNGGYFERMTITASR